MRNAITVLIFSFLSAMLRGQEAELYLDKNEKGNVIREATDRIRLLPGFSYSAEPGETFIGRIANSQNEGNNNSPHYNDALNGNAINVDPDYFGSISGSLDVNQLGAAVYSIPIVVAPGTAGMEPRLSIVYNSQGGEGLLGAKWSIGGLSAISRVSNSPFPHEYPKPINFDSSDQYFALDGNFIAENGELYNNSFFEKVHKRDGYFEVEHKNGQTWKYGQSEDSKVFVSGISDEALSWNVNEITDMHGNNIQFVYETINEEVVIKQILYTGNKKEEKQPFNCIVFEYTDRNLIRQYISKGILTQSNRLKSIQFLSENGLYKEILFEYSSNKEPRLKTITEKAGDKEIRSLSVDWGDLGQGRISPKVVDARMWRSLSGDFDGDGCADILEISTENGMSLWKSNTFASARMEDVIPVKQRQLWVLEDSHIGDFRLNLILRCQEKYLATRKRYN